MNLDDETIEALCATVKHRQGELEALLETLIGFDTSNPPGRVIPLVEFIEGFCAGLHLHTHRIVPETEDVIQFYKNDAGIRRFCENYGIDVAARCVEARISEELFWTHPQEGLRKVYPEGIWDKPTLVITLPGTKGAAGKKLNFFGHTDVVPAGDLSAWRGMDPFSLTKKDGADGKIRYFGRGVADTKGSVAAILFALKMIVEGQEAGEITPFEGTFVCYLTPDEETSSILGTQYLVRNNLIEGSACIVGEPTVGLGNKAFITLGERGFVGMRLTARGKPAHSSLKHMGENAIEKLLAACDAVLDLEQEPVPVTPELAEVIECSIEGLTPEFGTPEQLREMFSRTQVTLGTIRGGLKNNVVPDEAEVSLSFRTLPGITEETLVKSVKSALKGVKFGRTTRKKATRLKISDVDGMPASFAPNSGEIYACLQTNAEAVFQQPVRGILYPGATDACHVRSTGIPTIVFGVGAGNIHEPLENVLMDDFVNVATTYFFTVADYLQ